MYNMESNKLIGSLDPSSTLARAYLLMQKGGCESLPVRLNGEVVGVLSMQDVEQTIHRYLAGNSVPDELTVGKCMRIAFLCVDGDETLSSSIRTMLEREMEVILVTNKGHIIGTIYRDKLLKSLIPLSKTPLNSVMDALQLLNLPIP